MRTVVLAEKCFWCKTALPALRDLDTGYAWCVGCASATVYKGDPIDYYEELTPEAAAYSQLLAKRSFSRRDRSADGPD